MQIDEAKEAFRKFQEARGEPTGEGGELLSCRAEDLDAFTEAGFDTLALRRQIEVEKYRRVYREYPNYTNREGRIALTREWIERHKAAAICPTCAHEPVVTLLDVGAGRGEVVEMANGLAPDLSIVAWGFEVLDELCNGADILPIPGAHDLSRCKGMTFDLVTCTDVMEHLLEEDVPAALSEIARVARSPVLLTICHMHDRPGKWGDQPLHITVHPREWWEDKIREHMGAEPRALYTDRVDDRGTWYEVMT